jgi:hypothetical protein
LRFHPACNYRAERHAGKSCACDAVVAYLTSVTKEAQFASALPSDYRRFLKNIADSGIGQM